MAYNGCYGWYSPILYAMLTNSKQYLTNLASAGIVQYQQHIKYHCQCNASIAMVLSKYGTDGFVSVWYSHHTDCSDLQKTFEAWLVFTKP